MALWSCIKDRSLSRIDTLKKLSRVAPNQESWIGYLLLFFEVDEIFVVLKNLDVCKWSPSLLNSLCSHCLSWFHRLFLLSLLMSSPGPLYLDRCYVINCKSVVLEKSPCQSHFVSSLNNSSTVVLPTLFFWLVKDVEWGCEELRSQALVRR